MSMNYIRKIPTPDEVTEQLPLPDYLKEKKSERDKQIKAVFENKSDKFLLIIGPCSADNADAVSEYVVKLARVQEKVNDKIIIIPRIYTNKPRTTGTGYKGMMHQPDLMSPPNISEGILAVRELHLRVLKESELSAADEMLYPDNEPYLDDVLSYIAVGARSVENQQHRLTVSGLSMPIGMKNPTSGDYGVMFNSIMAAQTSHIFIYKGYEVETTGNPYAHAILRGAVNDHGIHIPNYHYEDLLQVCRMYEERELKYPGIIVDTNHSNSGKDYLEQPRISREILFSRKGRDIIKKMVKGLMIESYLEEGRQSEAQDVYGKSITDPCLGWDQTEQLIYMIAENL